MKNVCDYGAIGDGSAFDSPAIQAAIDALPEHGGTVFVPAGIYRCGTIHLRSGVTLNLDPAAVIRASNDLDDFPRLAEDGDIGDHHHRHLIVAKNVSGIRITGGGTVDGQGPAFWQPQAHARAWIYAKEDRVSPCIEIHQCQDVTITDVKIVESPGWTLHLSQCDRVRISGVTIDNHRFGPNNDGFDINGCRDVHISDCRIDTCDDAIVMKTSRDSRSCERITITGCILSSNCAAIKCGTESYHDFRQITVSSCVVTRSTRAFALYGFDGGIFEQISVNGLVCDTNIAFILNHPIHLDARQRSSDSKLSVMRDIQVRGLSAHTDGRLLLTAADGCRIEDVILDGIQMRYALFCDPAEVAPGANSAQCSRHSPDARAARAAVVVDGVHDLRLRNLLIAWPESQSSPGWGEDAIRIENGGDRQFGPASTGDEVPMAVLWARNSGGQVDLLHLHAYGDGEDTDIDLCPALEVNR